MKRCGICETLHPDSALETVTLTDAEAQAVLLVGVTDRVFVYCKPCWGLMSNKAQAVALMTGSLEMGLRQAEVPDAATHARRFRDFLLSQPGQAGKRRTS